MFWEFWVGDHRRAVLRGAASAGTAHFGDTCNAVIRARGVNGFITRAWQLLAGPPGLELQSDGQRNAATAHAVERNHGKSLAL